MTNRPCSTDFDNNNKRAIYDDRKEAIFLFFFLVLVARTHGSRIEGRDGREEIMEAREGEKGKGEKGNKRKGIQLCCVSFDLIRFDRSADERELRLHLIDYVYP